MLRLGPLVEVMRMDSVISGKRQKGGKVVVEAMAELYSKEVLGRKERREVYVAVYVVGWEMPLLVLPPPQS